MRDFGSSIDMSTRQAVIDAAEQVFAAAKRQREVPASDFALEIQSNPIMVLEAEVKWPQGRMRIAKTTAKARPPFEWLMEITSNINEGDYFKHYLILDNDIVLAQRKTLIPIDETEANIILADLAEAKRQL